MCKHVAAVLYGIGARLDREPGLLFTLRQAREADLVGGAGARAAASLVSRRGGTPGAQRIADEASLSEVFGIDVAAGSPAAARGRKKTSPRPSASGRGPAKTPPAPVSAAKGTGRLTAAERRKTSERLRKSWAARRRALKKG